ncbi:MAG: GNAT family N-acetyltransferase [Pseudorhodoplanes sp.]
MPSLAIAESIDTDLETLRAIHCSAFGGAAVGHVLFTAVRLEGSDLPVDAAILCPLAVVPQAQGQGIGSALVDAGLRRLADAGTALVFVLGDPAFYGRFGFIAAAPHGLAAPFALPAAYRDAWQVCALHDDLPAIAGTIVCADALMRPAYWIE